MTGHLKTGYRCLTVIISLVALVPFVVIPATLGLSVADLGIVSEKGNVPEGPDGFVFIFLELYYLFFLLTNLLPIFVLSFWALGSNIEERFNRWTVKRKRGGVFASDREPLVTILIPCYNESRYVAKAISSCFEQDYKGPLEIIVIDDGSKDNTWSVSKIFENTSSYRSVRTVHKKNGGKASALRFGASQATGEILVMTDGDSELHRSAVTELANTFRRYPDAGVVGGFVHLKNNAVNHLTRLQQFEYVITQVLVRSNQSSDGSVLIAPGPVFGILTNLARSLPPLDRTVVEDCDLTNTVLSTRYTTRSNFRAMSRTNAPENWNGWFRQRRRWIYGQFQSWRVNRWHLKRNPWALFTYATWVLTTFSALVSIVSLLSTGVLLIFGGDYYGILEFVSIRSLMVLLAYLGIRALVLLAYRETRPSILFLPLMTIYDLVSGFLTAYLFGRYVMDMGVRLKWGIKEEVVH